MSVTSSIASAIKGRDDRKIAQAALYEIVPSGFADSSKSDLSQAFQYYPETISDSRNVDYVLKHPIGSSHPIYQWVYSNARGITFKAVFTNEASPDVLYSQDSIVDKVGGAIDTMGSTISSFVKNPVGAAIGATKSANRETPYSVNIANAIRWLRAKTYPLYDKGGLAHPPPKMYLYLPNSGISSGVGGKAVFDSVPVIMLSCDVTYEAFFRNGVPRIVEVDLAFAEIVQVGKNWGFIGRDSIDIRYIDGGNPMSSEANKDLVYRNPMRQPVPLAQNNAKSLDAGNNIADIFKTIA